MKTKLLKQKCRWGYLPSQQILAPGTSQRRDAPTSPGHPLNIIFGSPGNIPVWRPGDVKICCPKDLMSRRTFGGRPWDIVGTSVVCSKTLLHFSAQKLNWSNLCKPNIILSSKNWHVYVLITDSRFSGFLYHSYALYWR